LIGLDGWASEAMRRAPVEDLPNIHYLMEHGAWTLAKRSVMSSDHGGTGKHHGEFTILELETPFIVSGRKIRQNFEFPMTIMQYDTPAIIADILGLKIPEDWRGRPVKQIYK